MTGWKATIAVVLFALICAPSASASQKQDDEACQISETEPDAAIAACSRLIASGRESGRDLAARYDARAYAWSRKGDREKTRADLDEVIRIDPRFAYAYQNRAFAWHEDGEHDRAIADINEAMKISPRDADSYAFRGLSYHLQGIQHLALADYEEAVRIDPGRAVGYIGRAQVRSDTGDQDGALADIEVVISHNAKDGFLFATRGLIWSRKGDQKRALRDYDEAIRLDPKLGLSYARRGLVYESKGEFDRARADFNVALNASGGGAPLVKQARSIATERLRALDAGTQPAVAASTPPPPATASTPAPPAPVVAAVAPSAAKAVDAPPAGRRVALVIGNSEYKSVPALPNPRRDAAAVGASLRAVGFQSVTLVNDLTRDRMIEALRAFAAEADKADWAMIYFAGHGIELGGTNYMIPVDAKLISDRDVQFEAVPLDQVMSATEGARKLRLIMLDACRDNPFAAKIKRTVASRSIGRGLAQVEPDVGTLVVYAAKDGQVAMDGDGGNSPFAQAFIKHVATPGVEINKLFRLVRDDVLASTGRRQQPFSYGSVPGSEDFYFTR